MLLKNFHQNLWRVTWVVLGVASIVVSVLALNPVWRTRLQAVFLGDQRQLLATVSGELLSDGIIFKVLKFSTAKGIIVEVVTPNPEQVDSFTLVDRIFIPDPHDGYFSLNTHATRLALVDVDGDGKPEILAPSFDNKLVAHLNTLRLDPDTRRLELVRPPASAN